jgi:xanthine phosphoribosyltransferase
MATADETYKKMFTVSWQELHRDCKALAWKLVAGGPWRGIVAITRGGLIPAGIIARELDLRIIDTISVATYQGQQIGETSNLLKPLAQGTVDATEGPRWLIIDDLVDTGRTLELVRRLYPKAHFATVYAKPSGRPMVDSYITEVSQDTWIFFPWDMALQYVQPFRGKD